MPSEPPHTDQENAGADENDRSMPSEPSPRRPVATIAVAVVAVLAVALLGLLAFTQQSRIGDLEDRVEREDDIARAAGEFAEALLTYDHDDLDAATEAVASKATPSFADEYRDAFGAGLGAQIEELEASSTATIHEVLVNRAEGDTARVIVVADTEITSAEGSEARVGSYIDLSLVRIDGEWLVDEVQSVANAGDGPAAPPTDGDSTEPSSTTSAPG